MQCWKVALSSFISAKADYHLGTEEPDNNGRYILSASYWTVLSGRPPGVAHFAVVASYVLVSQNSAAYRTAAVRYGSDLFLLSGVTSGPK